MNVFTGSQAIQMTLKNYYPPNSIGLAMYLDRWFYWYSDGFKLDFGTAETEEEAFRKAKLNIR